MKLTGAPQIFDLNPWEQSAYQQHNLGAKGIANNGDIYRYTRVISTGSDLTAGKLTAALDNESAHQNITVAIANVIGDTKVVLDAGATAVDANEYDEGTLVFNDNSPEGETYGITHHEANAGSLETDIFVSPALKTATVADSSEASLVRNPWNNVVVCTTSLLVVPSTGVPVVDWDVSVAGFGWLKTRGVAAVLADSTGVTDGYMCTVSDEDTGAVGVRGTIGQEVLVGQAMETGTDTEYNSVYLMID